jgi:predicted unusual protein kinase regulating ubiquinone biosynthesis (AarF/ABC1/UbiB family)
MMTQHIHRLNRLSQIVRFLSFSRLFFWTLWVIYGERRRMSGAQARGTTGEHSNSAMLVQMLVAFREAAVKQGGLLIKLGQFLSTHVELLPEQAIAVLSSLQDEVPPAPFAHIVSVIESELGKSVEEVFSLLERKCTAAASLGQVHKAVLASTGETVAVKIQRPQIDQQVRLDLRALKFVIWVITRLLDTDNVIDLMDVYQEFERTIFEELDYVREAANAKRFKELFKDDPTISIPRVYDQYVARRILVLEWVDGIKINDYAALEAAGINRFEVARRTVSAYFYQFFEVGFFHADPHPGNIFVKQGPPGEGPIVTFVDFGMVGGYTQQMQWFMKEAFLALLVRDSRSFVNALAQLGFIGEGADMTSIERSLSQLLEGYYGMTLGKAGELSFTLLQEIGQLLYRQPFRIPAQFAFTGRAVGMLIGIATGLAPELDMVELATPYVRRFLYPDAKRMEQAVQQFFSQVLTAGKVLLMLPRALEQILTKLETGQFEIKLASNESSGWGGLRGRRSARGASEASAVFAFTWLFMFAASLAGGIILLTDAHRLIAGWFCFALTGLSALRVWVKN